MKKWNDIQIAYLFNIRNCLLTLRNQGCTVMKSLLFWLVILISPISYASELFLKCSISGAEYIDGEGEEHQVPKFEFTITPVPENEKLNSFFAPKHYQKLDTVYIYTTSYNGKELARKSMGFAYSPNSSYWVEKQSDKILLTSEYAPTTIKSGGGNYLADAFRYLEIDRLNGKLKVMTFDKKVSGMGDCSSVKRLF
ncbi:hypothetical protein AB4140_13845 [Shewanella sp. 10N.286.51.B2]|uniref:hypothetical protein n=1 Tax=Shewanella sp. 10N.286.51.B2 TaxID=3229707 RepID=UPI00354C85F1